MFFCSVVLKQTTFFLPLAFPGRITVGEVKWSADCFPLRVAATNNTGQNVGLFMYLVYNGDVKADRKRCEAASLTASPVSLHFSETFHAWWQIR